jgi:tetratricopeptide (TPR) repeat protein
METSEMKIRISLAGMILLVVMTPLPEFAQSPLPDLRGDRGRRGVLVHGQISSETPFAGTFMVELVANGHNVSASTHLGPDGSFEFPSVTPGGYELRMTNAGGTVIYSQAVMISGPEPNLSINVPVRPNAAPNSGGTVSIRQLQHKIPPEARKEFSEGIKASKKGDHQSALDHFQKAVSIDPELADGYNNLGSAQAALGQLEQAAKQFQKAIDLVPDHSLALANLSVTLCKMEQYPDAEQLARRALKLDSSLLKIRYILAVSLIAQHRNNAEVLENLQRAAPEVPKAHLVAAELLVETGRPDDAAKQIEEYLSVTPQQDADRQKVETWLAEIRLHSADRQQQATPGGSNH